MYRVRRERSYRYSTVVVWSSSAHPVYSNRLWYLKVWYQKHNCTLYFSFKEKWNLTYYWKATSLLDLIKDIEKAIRPMKPLACLMSSFLISKLNPHLNATLIIKFTQPCTNLNLSFHIFIQTSFFPWLLAWHHSKQLEIEQCNKWT